MKTIVESILEGRQLKRSEFKDNVYQILSELAYKYEVIGDDEPDEKDWEEALEYFNKKFFKKSLR